MKEDDAISRQAAISDIHEMQEWHTGDAFNADRVIRHLKDLPSVTPKAEPCEDAISRQAAVYIASGACHPANIADELAKLPPVTPKPCEDTISRQAALEKIHWLGLDNDTAIKCDLAIRALPSVNPQEPQTMHWQKHTDASGNSWHACPRCGHIAYTLSHYCPDCGARLEAPS